MRGDGATRCVRLRVSCKVGQGSCSSRNAQIMVRSLASACDPERCMDNAAVWITEQSDDERIALCQQYAISGKEVHVRAQRAERAADCFGAQPWWWRSL